MTWSDIKYFTPDEFKCKCGCGLMNIDMELVKKLDRIRSVMQSPMAINSACRCIAHNQKVGGLPDSAHLTGKAADIGIEGSVYRFLFLRLAFTMFRRIKIYKTFVHVDVDETKPSPVCAVG